MPVAMKLTFELHFKALVSVAFSEKDCCHNIYIFATLNENVYNFEMSS
jgi:hypothetical protein